MLKQYIRKNSGRYASKWLVLFIDLCISAAMFFMAYTIRFGLTFNFNTTNFKTQLPFMIGLSLIGFLLIGSYKGVVRHTGLKDVQLLFKALLLTFMFGILFNVFNDLYSNTGTLHVPTSVLCMFFLLNIFALTSSRFAFKHFYLSLHEEIKPKRNILIYGAGESGQITHTVMGRDGSECYAIIGFIDDNPGKVGKYIKGSRVYRKSDIDSHFIKENDIEAIILSIQNIDSKKLMTISDALLQLGVKVKIVPPVNKWIDGSLNASQIKEIQIEDLLDRAPILLDNAHVEEELSDQTVIVTGAAGSIGSEIVRQLSHYSCKELILIDQAESALYDLQQELKQKNITNFVPIVADIRDYERMKVIFQETRPTMLFHAAAYKHVPLMEANPSEAVKINVLGTRNLANLAMKFRIEKFVLVSTDKAVNPTNVMGATKRVAEMYLKCLQKESKTKFITTRFGNVLGSNGSVIPLFKKQINQGGPLTVTHPEVTRYFMTIPEASQLVIEAATMGDGGEIFIFDMGESVKIVDLAKKMINLSGLSYPQDIDIEFVGLRPGEKLYEELLATGEGTLPTHHKKIMKSKFAEIDCSILKEKINDLCIIDSFSMDKNVIVSKLKEIVPEYISKNSEYELLDHKKNNAPKGSGGNTIEKTLIS
ncbi:MAG TPA: polysaccharide biosynthesis protein [Leeuwenhoekiella sp.]|nr:polysaccharide biosynthesis protein [Leeuwenhoekiella sp.]